MAFGDIYELTDEYTLEGQTCYNVYFFRQNNLAVPTDASVLLDSFEGTILPAVVALQSDDALHTALRARNLFNEGDNAERAISVEGEGGTADDFPTFVSLGISLGQDNGAVKNGAKRIAGVPEGAAVDGVINDALYIAAVLALQTALETFLPVGLAPVWAPVIVKRIAEIGGGYRLPTNAGEAVYGTVTDAEYNPVLTSQVSRKIGRGI
jgi:hypothetical protein